MKYMDANHYAKAIREMKPMQKFVINWFPGKETLFVYVEYGDHFTQGGDTLFVKTHEPYRKNNITCNCGGSWNARNEHGCAVHFCNDNPVVLMRKKTRLLRS